MTGDDYDRVFLDQDQPRLHVLLHPLDQAPHHWHHPLLLPGLHEHEDLLQVHHHFQSFEGNYVIFCQEETKQ